MEIYSYIETKSKSFVPPIMKGGKVKAPEYLTEIDGRHYISVDGKLPKQPKEIKLDGPINLKIKKNTELREKLKTRSSSDIPVRMDRQILYPSLGDQLGAIMKEFTARKKKGEKLTPELDEMIDRILEIKKEHPIVFDSLE